jgi:hypothetical protein
MIMEQIQQFLDEAKPLIEKLNELICEYKINVETMIVSKYDNSLHIYVEG